MTADVMGAYLDAGWTLDADGRWQDSGSSVNHEFINEFVEKHGHRPWIICGDPDYPCLLDAHNGAGAES